MPPTVARLWAEADQIARENYLHKTPGGGDAPAARMTNAVRYLVEGAADEAAAHAAALAAVPAAWDGVPLRELRVVERRAEEDWVVEASYGALSVSGGGGGGGGGQSHYTTYSFRTTGGATLLRLPLAVTDHDEAAPQYAPCGLNPDGEGQPQGQEVVAPVCDLDVTHWWREVPMALVKNWMAHTGRVNAAAFEGFAAKEVLFSGCEGTKGGSEAWHGVTFHFSIRPSQTLTIPFCSDVAAGTDAPTQVRVAGWQYLNVRSARVGDDQRRSAIVAWQVCDLYPSATFPSFG